MAKAKKVKKVAAAPIVVDKHEQEVDILQAIADTKDQDALFNAADETAWNEEAESHYHAIEDGLYAGLKHAKGKKLWAVQLREEPGVEEDFNAASYAFFVGKSFAEVKKRLEALPNR